MKNALRPGVNLVRRWLRDLLPHDDTDVKNQQLQRIIVNQYLDQKNRGVVPYRSIRESGFRVYSEFEEDGIILYILSMIGFGTRRVVEIGCGFGKECMATNLILNHGFEGFLFDGSAENVKKANEFFAGKRDCHLHAPTVTQAWITAESVNDLLVESGCAGEVDVLSIDIDGNDYWVWKAIEAINPRLIVFETHDIIPQTESLTIPYTPDFYAWDKPGAEVDFRGVSLLAIKKLCAARGYRLIGSHQYGFNAFFLRNDEGLDWFPEVSIGEVHDNPHTRRGQKTRWPLVKDMPWVEV